MFPWKLIFLDSCLSATILEHLLNEKNKCFLYLISFQILLKTLPLTLSDNLGTSLSPFLTSVDPRNHNTLHHIPHLKICYQYKRQDALFIFQSLEVRKDVYYKGHICKCAEEPIAYFRILMMRATLVSQSLNR